MISIIDCEIGNLRSVQKAFEFIGVEARITSDSAEILNSRAIVLPGVGAFGDAIGNLRANNLVETIHTVIKENKPFLGICVGLQLFVKESEEFDMKPLGLGLITGKVIRLPNTVKVPEMGWNTIAVKRRDCPLLAGLPEEARFYFAHSYCLDISGMTPATVAATTTYGLEYCSVVWREGNVFGTQFHPEKSGVNGLKILKNFAKLAS
jgi:imidazole glycerol-phosphate synthase subunit HisH